MNLTKKFIDDIHNYKMGADPFRPRPEIEITTEMIEMGASAVNRCLGAGVLYPPMTEEVMAEKVFRAMNRAKEWLKS